jgi:hypothetical protein
MVMPRVVMHPVAVMHRVVMHRVVMHRVVMHRVVTHRADIPLLKPVIKLTFPAVVMSIKIVRVKLDQSLRTSVDCRVDGGVHFQYK